MSSAATSPDIQFVGVSKHYGDVLAVDDVSLRVERRSFHSLLGPSGCGKTTSLRLIAGFEQPTSGDVRIRDESAVGVPAYRRPVNMLFQHYALFPHLTVGENVGYGLKQRKPRPPKSDIDANVDETLELVHLPGYTRRRVWELSGGQQQRVALARALINRPTVLLLDEPLERGAAGGYVPALSLAQYANLPARLKAFTNTLTLAPLGTLACLLIAYPFAYFLATRAARSHKPLLLTLVIIPFWTSFLIRTYAWIYILGGRGIPALLDFVGIEGVRLINTPFAVLVGIVYGYLPLMIFPIYVSLEKLDKRLLEASSDLGADRMRTFLQVTLPLSMPGIITGSLLVFI